MQLEQRLDGIMKVRYVLYHSSRHLLTDAMQVSVVAGETTFIPGGWMHAGWTPQDSISFFGNFSDLLSFTIQSRINALEQRLRSPQKQRFALAVSRYANVFRPTLH